MLLAGIPVWIWASFLVFVLGMLALDLGVFHRQAHEVKPKEALIWTGVWIGLAMVFNAGIFIFWDNVFVGSPYSSQEAGLAFLTGFLVEKALSVDNIFVFLFTFMYFKVPAHLQHRVLFWGIIGALIFRAVFVAAGATMLEHFAWTMILFGALLIVTAIKLVLHRNKKADLEKNPFLRGLRRVMPVTKDFVGERFFTRIDGKLWATPLFAALLVIEFSDLIFAVDSIPAIFAITQEPFIVFTSNVFAILGLRSLFFAVGGLVEMFRYLSFGLAGVLGFIGVKMLYGYAEKAIWPDMPKFPVLASLAVIVAILGASIVASIMIKPSEPALEGGAGAG